MFCGLVEREGAGHALGDFGCGVVVEHVCVIVLCVTSYSYFMYTCYSISS